MLVTTVISPPEEIAYLFFLRNCVAFLKLDKRIPLWERFFSSWDKNQQKYVDICIVTITIHIWTALWDCSEPMLDVTILCEFAGALAEALVDLVDYSPAFWHPFSKAWISFRCIGWNHFEKALSLRWFLVLQKSWLGESRLFLLETLEFSDEIKLLPWSKASANTLRSDFILILSFFWLWLTFY